MQQPSESGEIRCVCSRTPLLAKYGLEDGKPWIHLRVYKQHKIYGEAFFTGGEVHLHCRECLRWMTLKLTGRVIKVEKSESPLSDDGQLNR
jgi:hypothetical protein